MTVQTDTQSLRRARRAGLAAFVGTTIEWYDNLMPGESHLGLHGPKDALTCIFRLVVSCCVRPRPDV
ncbi:hypothetical protein [Amycolatopsis sp. lyj-108]|uniref:hypothetical protein n=1 Tax=Amycolatopsis sp. lyj-108 TaxID=2789286 RepID=UPI00397D9CF0